ncbi:MAG: CPBP family intramembrane metalloprotease [Anaerolineae bacterium]
MNNWNWTLFGVLVAGGALGAVAIIPYAFAISRDRLAQLPLPPRVLALAQFAQALVLTALAAGLGLLAARPIGLGAPVLEALLAGEPVSDLGPMSLLAVGAGVAAGAVIVILQVGVVYRVAPELRAKSVRIPLWKRFIAGFYGGINEEILMRLGVLSGAAWVLSRLWPGAEGALAPGVFWAANLLAALVFGVGHLGAAASLTRLTPAVIGLVLVLNGIGGVVFGWLYGQYGLLAAMIAHFSADMVLHVITPFLLRSDRGAQDAAEEQPSLASA